MTGNVTQADEIERVASVLRGEPWCLGEYRGFNPVGIATAAIAALHDHRLTAQPVSGGERLNEQAVMVCPQCAGEGSYADGLDEAACTTECTRCGSNGWIVDLAALSQPVTVASPGSDWFTGGVDVDGNELITVRKAEWNTICEQREKFMWQVRDTCARAEKAEAGLAEGRREVERLRKALVNVKIKLFDEHSSLLDVADYINSELSPQAAYRPTTEGESGDE